MREVAFALALLLCAPHAAAAGAAAGGPEEASAALARLRSGSAVVSGAEARGGWVFLRLLEGGEIAVPADHFLGLEPYPNSRAPRSEQPASPPRPPAGPAPDPAPPAPLPQARPAGEDVPAEAAGGAAGAPERFRSLIGEVASRHALDPDLVAAMVRVESNFEPRAVSSAGALGLLQLMPETARLMGVSDPFDPEQNLDAGARHFRGLLDRFRGDIVLALAAYNAGAEAIQKHRGLPPFSETRAYVDRVITHFARGF